MNTEQLSIRIAALCVLLVFAAVACMFIVSFLQQSFESVEQAVSQAIR